MQTSHKKQQLQEPKIFQKHAPLYKTWVFCLKMTILVKFKILRLLVVQILQLKSFDQYVLLLFFFLKISKYLTFAQCEMTSDFEILNFFVKQKDYSLGYTDNIPYFRLRSCCSRDYQVNPERLTKPKRLAKNNNPIFKHWVRELSREKHFLVCIV